MRLVGHHSILFVNISFDRSSYSKIEIWGFEFSGCCRHRSDFRHRNWNSLFHHLGKIDRLKRTRKIVSFSAFDRLFRFSIVEITKNLRFSISTLRLNESFWFFWNKSNFLLETKRVAHLFHFFFSLRGKITAKRRMTKQKRSSGISE